MQEIRLAIMGLGNIGRNLLDILVARQQANERAYGVKIMVTGVADSSGTAVCPSGLDAAALRDLKLARKGVATCHGAGRPGQTALEMLQDLEYDVLLDAAPTNIQDGEPGLSCVRHSLAQGRHVIMADKGPLVLAFGELANLAREHGARLLYSATVAGGLPTVNIGVRDLAGSGVTRVEGIFNGTTNYILTRMAEEGIEYPEALAGAQAAGIAEADPTLDVDGWDAANKLVIIANSVLRRPTALADLQVRGIRDVTLRDLQAAQERGQVIKPLAIAQWTGSDYQLTVGPVALDARHPMALTGMWDMGVVYHTDYMGVISAVIEEKGPVPTSAAVLRDILSIYTGY
ncbi:MAG: homoserine dehydrogenase [Anaerolineae bacterium]|jgi:homoserine dehydrogenase|nr:homoserine dehydrogenase [Chloroflexota bacterium]